MTDKITSVAGLKVRWFASFLIGILVGLATGMMSRTWEIALSFLASAIILFFIGILPPRRKGTK